MSARELGFQIVAYALLTDGELGPKLVGPRVGLSNIVSVGPGAVQLSLDPDTASMPDRQAGGYHIEARYLGPNATFVVSDLVLASGQRILQLSAFDQATSDPATENMISVAIFRWPGP